MSNSKLDGLKVMVYYKRLKHSVLFTQKSELSYFCLIKNQIKEM